MNDSDGAEKAESMTSTAPAWKGLIVPAVLVIAAMAVLVTLGNWQMRRLVWKEALIARVDERFNAPAVSAPGPAEWPALTTEAIDYLHVELSGHFLPGELHVYAVLGQPRGAYSGPGYWIVSPFESDAGWTVFVNRGFVPDGKKESASRPGSDAPSGPFDIDGTIRRAEPAGSMTPDADAAKNVWFVRDPEQMAAALGLDAARVAPFTVDLRASHATPGALPQPGETKISFNNPHLGYALTWYGVALAALGVFVAFAFGRLRTQR